MGDLYLCDVDVLNLCDPVAFDEAAITLLLIMAIVLCIGIAYNLLNRE